MGRENVVGETDIVTGSDVIDKIAELKLVGKAIRHRVKSTRTDDGTPYFSFYQTRRGFNFTQAVGGKTFGDFSFTLSGTGKHAFYDLDMSIEEATKQSLLDVRGSIIERNQYWMQAGLHTTDPRILSLIGQKLDTAIAAVKTFTSGPQIK